MYGSIVGDDFSIHPVTGVITTSKALDREAQGVYAVTGTSGRMQLLNCSREFILLVSANVMSRLGMHLFSQFITSFSKTVYARDGGSPPNFAKTTVRVTVLDENDNRPAFGRVYYSLEVPENQEPVTLFTIRATDQDSGDSGVVHYKITGINAMSNIIVVVYVKYYYIFYTNS